MIGSLKGGGIRGFVVECGIVGQNGMGDIGYRNDKRSMGFNPGRYKSHGTIGCGNASISAAYHTTPGDMDRGIGHRGIVGIPDGDCRV